MPGMSNCDLKPSEPISLTTAKIADFYPLIAIIPPSFVATGINVGKYAGTG